MGQCKTLVNRDSVRNAITGVEHNTGRTTRCVQGKDCLDLHVECGYVEGFKHDLGHLFPVCLGIERGLCKEDWMFFRRNAQLIIEGVVPNLLHIVPIGDDTVFDRILQCQDSAL